MELKNKLSKYLLVPVALVTMLSIGAPSMANAKRVHHHYRTSQIYVHRHHRVAKLPKSFVNDQIDNFKHDHDQATTTKQNCRIIQKGAMAYINQVRNNVGLPTLKSNPLAQQIAYKRALFSAKHGTVSHTDSDGKYYVRPLLRNAKYYGNWDENSANNSIIPDQITSMVNSQTNNWKDGINGDYYVDNDAMQAAYSSVNTMVNHDGPSYGHRNSILDPYSDYYGVGVVYSKRDNNYYMIELQLNKLPYHVQRKANGRFTYSKHASNYRKDMDHRFLTQQGLKSIYYDQKISKIYTGHPYTIIPM